uniref:VQ domain-containing protein n=1 Tax=Kalanchoe fedtschenkoi TaxID=63787 RepID=A0A7N0T2R7_KALFE
MGRVLNSNRSSSKKKNLKVVYISSPMKVKTCASNFRSTVQQLTGRDSDIVDRLMDEYAHLNGLAPSLEIPAARLGHPQQSPTSSGSMPNFEEAAAGLFSGGGEGRRAEAVGDEGLLFEEIFSSGWLLEYPLDEAGLF